MEKEFERPDRGRANQRGGLRRQLQVLCLVAIVAVSLLVVGVVLWRSMVPAQPQVETTVPSTTQPVATTTPLPTEPETVITLVAGGDINVTDLVVEAGRQDGRYDYTDVFMDIAPILSQADAAILNFEGNLVGAPYGSVNLSAPLELMEALRSAGVDFIQMANSHSIKNGIAGLNTTLNRIRQQGMEPVGAFSSQEEYDQTQGFTIRNIGGIRVAIVAFTKGLSGLTLPAGSENRVNLLYKDYATNYQQIDKEGIQAVLQAVQAQQPDIVIAMLHWGSEHKSIISENQKAIKELMLEGGVDAIIGTHSHYVQTVEYDEEVGTVVAYSLGDLLGNANKADTNYSILLQLQITRNNRTGETKITACDYVSTYTMTPDRDGQALRILRLETAISMYERSHVDKVSPKTYESMLSARNKIKSKTGME